MIWTTTPWTIPANRAIAYNPDIAYAVYRVEALEEDLPFEPWAKPGDVLIVAEKLAADVFAAAKIARWLQARARSTREGMVCAHPLAALDAGYGFAVPLLAGDHVTDDAGTGFVHTAPGHGADDYSGLARARPSRDPRHRRRGRRLLSARAAVRRAEGAGDRGQEGRQVRPGQRRGDRQADRGRDAAGARAAGAQLSALLALQGAGDLPQHAAVVHPHGRAAGRSVHGGRTLRETALAAIDATAFYPAGRPQPHPLHGRDAGPTG